MATERHEGETLYNIQYVDGAPRLVEVKPDETGRGAAPWLGRHQTLVGLLGGGLLVACLFYVALLTVAETLGGASPAYAISTDVKGSPNVTVSAIPITINGATPTPGVLTVQADGTVKQPTSVSGISFPSASGGGHPLCSIFWIDSGTTFYTEKNGRLYTWNSGVYPYQPDTHWTPGPILLPWP